MVQRFVGAVFSAALVLGAVSAGSAAPDAGRSERIDALARDVLATGGAPGVAVAVVRDGAIVYAKGFGMRDVEHRLPVDPGTPFAIGSISKQFTAAAVLALVHDGKLTLDDRLEKYEPHLPNAAAITVRQLLNQTSGLHNYPLTTEHAWPLRGHIETQQIVDILTTDKADFVPGSRWGYSSANYAVLTAIVERVSGEPMGRFLAKRFFGPLGMERAGFGYAAQLRPGTALAYEGKASPFKRQDEISADLFSGAGAVYADVNDMAHWDAALLTGKVLTPDARALMFARGKLADGAPVDYGMGFAPATLDGHREVWHNGLSPGVGGYCYNALFPDDGVAIVVLSNGYNFDGRPERLVREIFREYVPSAHAAAPLVPAAEEDPAITARATEWLRRIQTGDIDRAQLTPAMDGALTPGVVAQVQAQITALGPPSTFRYTGKSAQGGLTTYVYRVAYASAALKLLFTLDPAGKIAGLLLQPGDG